MIKNGGLIIGPLEFLFLTIAVKLIGDVINHFVAHFTKLEVMLHEKWHPYAWVPYRVGRDENCLKIRYGGVTNRLLPDGTVKGVSFSEWKPKSRRTRKYYDRIQENNS